MSFLTHHKVLLVENEKDRSRIKNILDELIGQIDDGEYLGKPIRLPKQAIDLLKEILVVVR